MRPPTWIGALLLGGLFFGATGCSTPSARTRVVDSEAAVLGDSDLEKRASAHAAFAMGILLELQEDPAGALDAWTRTVELDPAREELRLEVARRRLARREGPEAIRLLSTGADLPGASPEIFSLLALAHLQEGRSGDAITAYRRALRALPDDLGIRVSLARLLDESGDATGALDVVADFPILPRTGVRDVVDLLDLLARLEGKVPDRGDVLRARVLTTLEGLDGVEVDDSRLAARIAERNAAAGRSAQAEAWFRKSREIAPTNPFSAARLAEIYLQSGRLVEAASELEALHRQDPTNPVPLYYLGVIALEQSDPARARERFERAILLNPEFEPAGLELIAVCLALDDSQGAVDAARRARERLRPGFRLAYLSAMAHARAGEWDAARAQFADAERLGADSTPNPVDHLFLFQVGAFLEQAGRSDEAVVYLERSLALEPEFDEALNHLGYMWAEQGVQLDRALDMIRRAVAAEPDNPAYLDSLGWVLFRLERPAEALPHLERAAALLEATPDATVLDHLGDVLAALGRMSDARAAWEKALAIEPSDAIRAKLGPPRDSP